MLAHACMTVLASKALVSRSTGLTAVTAPWMSGIAFLASQPCHTCRPLSGSVSLQVADMRTQSQLYGVFSHISGRNPSWHRTQSLGSREHSRGSQDLLGWAAGSTARWYSTTSQPLQPPRTALGRHTIYRGPWLLPFRLLVRMKVVQLSWIAALALPVWTVVSEVDTSGQQLVCRTVLCLEVTPDFSPGLCLYSTACCRWSLAWRLWNCFHVLVFLFQTVHWRAVAHLQKRSSSQHA